MTSLHHLGGADFDAVSIVWAVLALRAVWLLPDWLSKWQRLVRPRRRAGG